MIERAVERPWGRMACRVRAGGEPALLLVHGSRCDASDWNEVVPLLPAGSMVVVPDLAGHGGSEGPPPDVTFDGLAGDLVALLNALGIGRAVIVGHSLGGMLALAVARMAPDRVAGMALVEGWTRLGVPWPPARRMFGTLSEEAIAAIGRRNVQTALRWPESVHPSFWATVREADGSDVLATTDVPVLELYGDRGEPRPDGAELLVTDRPNIALRWIAGAGHYLPTECPAAVAEEIARWMRESGLAT